MVVVSILDFTATTVAGEPFEGATLAIDMLAEVNPGWCRVIAGGAGHHLRVETFLGQRRLERFPCRSRTRLTAQATLCVRQLTVGPVVTGPRAMPLSRRRARSTTCDGDSPSSRLNLAAAPRGKQKGGESSRVLPGLLATLVGMISVPLGDARDRLSEYVSEVERTHQRVTITRHGHPAAVLISADDLAAIEETMEILGTAGAVEAINEGLADADAGRFADNDALKSRYGLA